MTVIDELNDIFIEILWMLTFSHTQNNNHGGSDRVFFSRFWQNQGLDRLVVDLSLGCMVWFGALRSLYSEGSAQTGRKHHIWWVKLQNTLQEQFTFVSGSLGVLWRLCNAYCNQFSLNGCTVNKKLICNVQYKASRSLQCMDSPFFESGRLLSCISCYESANHIMSIRPSLHLLIRCRCQKRRESHGWTRDEQRKNAKKR